MTFRNILVLTGAAAALAACVSNPRPLPVATRAAPTGVEGTWTDPNGIVSTFQARHLHHPHDRQQPAARLRHLRQHLADRWSKSA